MENGFCASFLPATHFALPLSAWRSDASGFGEVEVVCFMKMFGSFMLTLKSAQNNLANNIYVKAAKERKKSCFYLFLFAPLFR